MQAEHANGDLGNIERYINVLNSDYNSFWILDGHIWNANWYYEHIQQEVDAGNMPDY
jgi:hypothetical protein